MYVMFVAIETWKIANPATKWRRKMAFYLCPCCRQQITNDNHICSTCGAKGNFIANRFIDGYAIKRRCDCGDRFKHVDTDYNYHILACPTCDNQMSVPR